MYILMQLTFDFKTSKAFQRIKNEKNFFKSLYFWFDELKYIELARNSDYVSRKLYELMWGWITIGFGSLKVLIYYNHISR